MRVAIIGGGLSGLATAVQLNLMHQQRLASGEDCSLQIQLFEAGDRVGGVIHTERIGDWVIDHGADMFATKPPAAIELMEKLGATDRLIEPKPNRRGARICFGGNLVPIPDGFVLMRATRTRPMWTTPLLSLMGKLRFFAERFVSARTPSGNDDESVASFVRRRMGNEVLDRIVAPLSAGIYTADVNKLSMRSTMGPIWAMERSHGSLAAATKARQKSGEDSVERSSTGARYGQFRSFPGGMIELIKTLSDSLPENTIQLQSKIDSLHRDDSNGTWNVVQNPGDSSPFDHVVIALPPPAAAKLLEPVSTDAAKSLRQIESASTAIVVLVVNRSDVAKNIDTFGFVVPASENRRILAGSFASHKFEGRADDDQVIIRTFIGGATQSELLHNEDETLIDIAAEELAEIIGLSGKPLWATVVRWNQAMPQYHVGHHQKIEQLESAIAPIEGLSVMNNAMHGVGIAPVIAQAGKVADAIFGALGSGGFDTPKTLNSQR
ncbi:Protoporphyrinogen oxidase [Rubripirellula obstinata]|uniref:Coproporphyrinogen III oxidase n=1 Tax=Rubripirellula obstinata TaxID=406547 RepID=A0A5B1CTI9_9BACT|nr:protoporphyrinogen oxidase [Rubripirellula obstinata]KAA1262544.1 Protoporphyrinogen oxidase [Rubripirellula obstinata]